MGDKPANSNAEQSKSFWTTLPGLLTAVAALITALAGLLGGLANTGIIGGSGATPTSLAVAPVTQMTQPAPAAELFVLETVPADGDADVDSGLDQIVIRFNGQVRQDSWSFVVAGSGQFPELAGEPRFLDGTTCVLPVKLKPETVYSLGFNSATRHGFRSFFDDQLIAEPYVLTFTTR